MSENDKIRKIEKMILNSYDKIMRIREHYENRLVHDLFKIEEEKQEELKNYGKNKKGE